jgi:hypothetical protein
LSTVSSGMVFDDHDVHDDWNTSWEWAREIRTVPWWRERILGAYMSYWIYQHLGNLSPAELAENALPDVREAHDAEESASSPDRRKGGQADSPARADRSRTQSGSRPTVVDDLAASGVGRTRAVGPA